jgi:hypothetical protein
MKHCSITQKSVAAFNELRMQRLDRNVWLKRGVAVGACSSKPVAASKATWQAKPLRPIKSTGAKAAQNSVDPSAHSSHLHQYIPSILRHYKDTVHRNKPAANVTALNVFCDNSRKLKICETILNFCAYFNCRPRTFFTSNNLFDRFVEVQPTDTTLNLTLTALTAFFIASKYEEIYPPSIADLCGLLNNKFSSSDVFDMEQNILRVVQFNFIYVCPLDAAELIGTQWQVHSQQVAQLSTLVLTLFSFERRSCVANLFKLAIFALSVAYRLVHRQSLKLADNILTSDDSRSFTDMLRHLCLLVHSGNMSCFEDAHKSQIAHLHHFLFENIRT